jgi:uncharacterized protein YdcH (DUF465 family)
MNKPIGGIVGASAREEALASMNQPSGGVTAGSVMQQQPPVRNQFEFVARGGVSNTANEYVQNAGRQMRMQDQMKQFETILAGQEKSAKAVYDDAVGLYGEEIKNWIPVPEMFIDESTGAFMPMQYQKALFTGVQEFKKMQKEQKAQEIAGSREERMAAAQTETIAQGKEKLAQGAQGLKQTGAYQQGQLAIGRERNRIETIKASKSGVTDDLKLIKEYESQLYKDQQEVNKLGDDIRNAEAVGDTKGAKEAENLRKKKLAHAMDAEKTIKKIKANAAGKPIDEKAITVATDIENSVAGLMRADDFETKYGYSVDKTGDNGERSPIDPDSDPTALKVYMYAQTIGVSNPKLTVQKIAEMLQSTPLEDIIQVIHKQRKSGIGK